MSRTLCYLIGSMLLLGSCKNDKKSNSSQTNIELESDSITTSRQDDDLSKFKKIKTFDSIPSSNSKKESLAVKPIEMDNHKTSPREKTIKKEPAFNEPKVTKQKIKKRPIIQYERLRYDFGEIQEGDIIELDINFTNVGNAPLQVLEADVTCGCTTPTVPFLDILPGESNKIGIVYNSVNKSGPQNPQITIKTNTEPAYHVFNLTGVVLEKTDTIKSPE